MCLDVLHVFVLFAIFGCLAMFSCFALSIYLFSCFVLFDCLLFLSKAIMALPFLPFSKATMAFEKAVLAF